MDFKKQPKHEKKGEQPVSESIKKSFLLENYVGILTGQEIDGIQYTLVSITNHFFLAKWRIFFNFPRLHEKLPNAILPNAHIPNQPFYPLYPMAIYPMSSELFVQLSDYKFSFTRIF